MAKKRKLKKPQKEVYRIEIDNWEVDHALIGRRKNDFYRDAMFGESSYLMMYGKIIWPEDQIFSKAQIFLNSKAEFDDHWKGENGKEESTVGFMQLSRDKGTLHVSVDLPARLFSQIQLSLAAEKIKFAQAYGEKLRWGKGLIFNIGFRTNVED
jgi:hypothetical protein